MAMNKRISLLTGSCALLAACSLLAKEPPATNSGVWVLQGETNKVYIAGSIHLLKPDNAALPDALRRAYDDAERLVFELDLDDLDQTLVATQMMAVGLRTDGRTLSQSLSAQDAARLSRVATKLGLPPAALERMESWLAAIMLTSVGLIKQGYSGEAGVDQQLATRAKKDGKPVTGLETPDEQFAAFDGLPEAEQRHLLEITLDELETDSVDLSKIEQAWRRGDQAALADLLQDDMADYPALEAAVLIERNRKWIPAIQAMLTGKDDVLVVVGAAHLLGDRGVISLLRTSGGKIAALPVD